MTPAKFIGYFRLLEHCAGSGCPVCRLVIDDTSQYLETLLYEHVTDPEARRGLRASWGFCNWHAFMLFDIDGSRSGAVIIYEDVVAAAITRIRHLAGRDRPGRFAAWIGRGRRATSALAELYRRRRRCPACVRATENEDRYLRAMIAFVDEPDFRAAYAGSDGLCVPHIVRALELAAGEARLDALVERTLSKWARLREDLGGFVRKQDYRNTEPYTEREALCYSRAFETISGARGLFGNDAHGRGRPR